jgi:hypothetical protein
VTRRAQLLVRTFYQALAPPSDGTSEYRPNETRTISCGVAPLHGLFLQIHGLFLQSDWREMGPAAHFLTVRSHFTSGEPMDAPVAGPPKVEHGSLLPARYRRGLEAKPPKRQRYFPARKRSTVAASSGCSAMT